MNQQRYRIVFNKARGVLMAVAETAKACGKGKGETSAPGQAPSLTRTAAQRAFSVRTLSFALWSALGLVFVATSASAQVVADRSAPTNQQPVVGTAPNGVPLVQIQTPSGAGVSRNTFSQFDVQSQGLILNNSRTSALTQLGGWVGGNPFLGNATARLILNEVNSSNPSQLRGFIEVAGSRAQVVVANPAGLSCDGCGFINASRATLTTGAPVINGGALEGYRVQGGVIDIRGAGLNASSTDTADLIARAVKVNAGLWAQQVNVYTGSQQVNVDANGNLSAGAALTGTGAKPDFAVDVAALGGMYANKIVLVGTESGVGVRNAGTLGAGVGEVILTSAGRLENSGRINAAGFGQISSAGLLNSGTLYASNNLSVSATGQIENRGTLASGLDLAITTSSNLTSLAGAILGAGVQSNGTVLDGVGTLRIQAAGRLSAQGQNLAGNAQQLSAASMDLSGSQTRARSLTLNADQLTNTGGTVRATANAELTVGELINGIGGELSAAQNLCVRATTLTNQGLLDAQNTTAQAQTLNNQSGGRIYGDHLAIAATTLNNVPTSAPGTAPSTDNNTQPVIAARSRLDLAVQTLNNRDHALIFSAGDLAIGGQLDANQRASGKAGTINNESATLEALGNVDIRTGVLNNLNVHFATDMELVSKTAITEWQLLPGNVFTPRDTTTRYRADQADVFECQALCLNIKTNGDQSDQFVQYNYTRTVMRTRVLHTDPAKILAGGSINIEADSRPTNDKSQILAGGNLNVTGADIHNIGAELLTVTTDAGSAVTYLRKRHSGNDRTNLYGADYNPAARQDKDIATGEAPGAAQSLKNQRFDSSATAVSADLSASLKRLSANGGGTLAVAPGGLYRLTPNATATYLIETDPRFTGFRAWLSSDYLLASLALGTSPLKRLGDGFYEQRLIGGQIIELTGQRMLDGYANDEAQYTALMTNARAVAGALKLQLGQALTAAQKAALTQNIVWLVQKTVTLPTGQTTQVLVPQVYLAAQSKAIQQPTAQPTALIAGARVNINTTGGFTQSGSARISAREDLVISANNINQRGGELQAQRINLQAGNDLISNGKVSATQSLIAQAGRDLTLASTTSTQTSAQGSRTNIDQQANFSVTGTNATLLVSAGRDLNLIAAALSNSGSSGTTTVLAGNNLNLSTVQEAQSQRTQWDAANFVSGSSRTDVGTQIQTHGDVRLQAGNNLNAQAARVTSEQGQLTATAAKDINVSAGQDQQTTDIALQIKNKSRGPLAKLGSVTQSSFNAAAPITDKLTSSKNTLTIRSHSDETTALASTFSGHTTTVLAGNNLTVTGSNLVSTAGTSLAAQNNIKLDAAMQTRTDVLMRTDTKSGLMKSGGIGLTLGKQQQSTDQKNAGTTALAGTIGSVEGNVQIQAGQRFTQVGSDLLAPQGDVHVLAQSLSVTEARQATQTDTETKFKQSGITVAITSPILSALQTADQMRKAAKDTSDGRMKLLAGATTGAAGYNTYNDIQKGQGQKVTIDGQTKDNQIVTKTDDNGKPIESRDATATDKAGGINLAISLGASSSQSRSTSKADNAAVSTLTAGRDITLTATGAGTQSNVTLQGTNLKAGSNVTLSADHQINLLAAQNTAEQKSTNRSANGSVGFSIGTNGLLFNVSASGARGKADGNDETYTNAHVQAGNTLNLQSGSDTTLKGAVAQGNKVNANIGGHLNIESLQDQSVYDSKQQSLGGSLSIGYGKASGSVNASQSKINSNYLSVIEQSAIRAGDGGFQINVGGNTTLTGAAITSTQAAIDNNANRFSTGGQLTLTDLQNKADYKATSIGINVGSGYSAKGGFAPGGTSAGFGRDSGSASSVTRSGISGMAGNKAARTGEAETGIQRIFNADKVQKDINAQTLITQTFGREAPKAIAIFASEQGKKLTDQARAAANAGDTARAQSLIEQAERWDEGGAYRIALHTMAGALAGGTGGALGAAATASSAQVLNTFQDSLTKNLSEAGLGKTTAEGTAQLLANLASVGLGAVASGGTTAGAAMGLNVDANNRQLHPTEIQWIKANAKRYAQKQGISEVLAETQLAQQAYRQVQFGVEGKWDADASAFLNQAKAMLPTDPNFANAGPGYMFYATPEQKLNLGMYASAVVQDRSALMFYAKNNLVQPSAQQIQQAVERDGAARNMLGNATVGAAVVGVGVTLPAALSLCLENPVACNRIAIAGGEIIGGEALGPTSLAIGSAAAARAGLKGMQSAEEANAAMRAGGNLPAWSPGTAVINAELMVGTKMNMIVDADIANKITNAQRTGDFSKVQLGGWGTFDEVKSVAVDMRQRAAITGEFKPTSAGPFYVVELVVTKPLPTNLGFAGAQINKEVFSDGTAATLNILQGGASQAEFLVSKGARMDYLRPVSVPKLIGQ